MTLANYSLEQFELDMVELCWQYPHNRNAISGDGCVYRNPKTNELCLLGMWLYERGLLLPTDDWNGDPAEHRLGNMGVQPEVAYAAACWQRAADCPQVDEGTHPLHASWQTGQRGPRLPWAAVPALVGDAEFQGYMGKLRGTILTTAAMAADGTLSYSAAQERFQG